MAAVARCEGEATRRSRPAATAWLFARDLMERGIFALHLNGDIRNGSNGVFLEAVRERWNPTADTTSPPRVVLSWWRLRGCLRVVRIRCFSPHRVDYDVAAASQRRVLHGGGLLGAVTSASFDSYRYMIALEVSKTASVDGCCGSALVLLPLSSGVVLSLSRIRVEL
jgi:hypothetical protein